MYGIRTGVLFLCSGICIKVMYGAIRGLVFTLTAPFISGDSWNLGVYHGMLNKLLRLSPMLTGCHQFIRNIFRNKGCRTPQMLRQ